MRKAFFGFTIQQYSQNEYRYAGRVRPELWSTHCTDQATCILYLDVYVQNSEKTEDFSRKLKRFQKICQEKKNSKYRPTCADNKTLTSITVSLVSPVENPKPRTQASVAPFRHSFSLLRIFLSLPRDSAQFWRNGRSRISLRTEKPTRRSTVFIFLYPPAKAILTISRRPRSGLPRSVFALIWRAELNAVVQVECMPHAWAFLFPSMHVLFFTHLVLGEVCGCTIKVQLALFNQGPVERFFKTFSDLSHWPTRFLSLCPKLRKALRYSLRSDHDCDCLTGPRVFTQLFRCPHFFLSAFFFLSNQANFEIGLWLRLSDWPTLPHPTRSFRCPLSFSAFFLLYRQS